MKLTPCETQWNRWGADADEGYNCMSMDVWLGDVKGLLSAS